MDIKYLIKNKYMKCVLWINGFSGSRPLVRSSHRVWGHDISNISYAPFKVNSNVFSMIHNFFPHNRVTLLFRDPEKVVIFYIFISNDPCTKLSLSVRILHHSLAIEALLTSSFFLIPRPPSNLGLQTLSQATKENTLVLVSLEPIFGNHKKFLLILSKSSLIFFFLKA